MRVRALIDPLRARDPYGYALHRAIRVAIVAPALFAFTFEVIGNAQLATFTVFGCFSLLLFVDFPGNRAGRLTSYSMLAVTGAVLITVGTLASRSSWLAVASMVVLGFAILFAGALSVSIAAAGRAGLLLFILPVSLPATAADIGPRLAGWGIASLASIPAAMLVWPPREHDDLRRYAAQTCEAIAEVITSRGAGRTERADELCNQVSESLAALRRTFRGTAFRPVGLTTGSRALVRLVDELEWLGSVVRSLRTEVMDTWPELARASSRAAGDVLRSSAAVLGADRRSVYTDDHGLNAALDRLAAARHAVAAQTRALLDPSSPAEVELPYQGHELSYAGTLVGLTVRWAAESDARPVLDRILGRPPAHQAAPLSPAVQIATSQIERHSVWLQNSIRGALGLGLSVGLAEATGAQHSFWVVLGTLSVLRSNALSTGSTVLRALAGTLVGFIIGSALVLAIGTSTPILWAVLPIAVLLAAFAPEAISFAAGQAGFTVVLLILFNIIAPVGWKVGLVRIEDIGLGCAASLVVGVLLWPRGAAAAIGVALSEAYRIGAAYLDSAVDYALGSAAPPTAELRSMLAAGRRLDDALRQYLAERGAKSVDLGDLTMAANGAIRLRLAGEAIAGLRLSDHGYADGGGDHLASSTSLIRDEARTVREWFVGVANSLDPHAADVAAPTARPATRVEEVLDVLRSDLIDSVAAGGDLDHAKSLLWTSLYLTDLRMLEARLMPHVAAIG